MLFAISSSHIALYLVPVRWVRCLPLTSFRFHLAMDTLVSLAGRFPLPGLVRDLHPLDDTHAGQTKSHSEITRYGTSMFYQRITLGSVTETNGPSTRKCSPNWQLHLWQRGTTYQHLSFESSSCTCAPSVASWRQPSLWHQLAFIPVAFSQYANQLPFLLPSLRLWILYRLI